MSGTLVLVRHGQSEWNLKNLFTGWKDPDLTEKGVVEARTAGKRLKAMRLSFDIAYTSALMAGRDCSAILERCDEWLDVCVKFVPLEEGQALIRRAALQRLLHVLAGTEAAAGAGDDGDLEFF